MTGIYEQPNYDSPSRGELPNANELMESAVDLVRARQTSQNKQELGERNSLIDRIYELVGIYIPALEATDLPGAVIGNDYKRDIVLWKTPFIIEVTDENYGVYLEELPYGFGLDGKIYKNDTYSPRKDYHYREVELSRLTLENLQALLAELEKFPLPNTNPDPS